MRFLKTNFPILLMILFEAAVGVFLLVNPEAFTRTVIILFGIVLLTIGITYLFRYLREKKEGSNNIISLIIAVVSLAGGVVCTFLSGVILGLITAIAAIYGVILVVSGVYKLHNYFQMKKSELTVSKISIISGLLAVILGLIVIIYPKEAALSVWQIAGIMLIAEAVIDYLSVVQMIRIKRDLK